MLIWISMGLQILNTDIPVIIVQPFPNFPVPITFGYATGVGDQKSCAAVQGVIFPRYSREVMHDLLLLRCWDTVLPQHFTAFSFSLRRNVASPRKSGGVDSGAKRKGQETRSLEKYFYVEKSTTAHRRTPIERIGWNPVWCSSKFGLWQWQAETAEAEKNSSTRNRCNAKAYTGSAKSQGSCLGIFDRH